MEVNLSDECAPFSYPNQQVFYTPDSELVRLSYTLTQNCDTDDEKIEILYSYVSKHISYDYELANEILSGETSYVFPDPDQTLAYKSGICGDIAILLAAMLRAQNIPTRLVKGWVPNKGDGTPAYHAWNEVWDGCTWVLYDATFSESPIEVSDYITDYIF